MSYGKLLVTALGTIIVLTLAGCYQVNLGIQKTYDVAVEKRFDFPISYRAEEIKNNEEDNSRNAMAPTVYIEPLTIIYYNEY